jgi:hypothetical protein
MIWCIANQRSYHSSLNIFAVIAGILLVRGNLKVARWVTMGLSLLLAAGVTMLVTIEFMFPLGYRMAVIREGGIGGIVSFLITIALLGLLFWLRSQLYRPEVIHAQTESAIAEPRRLLPIVLGIALPITITVFLGLMLHGDTAKEAMRRAEQQLGNKYHYVVTSMQMQSNMKHKSVSARVAAYNDTELKIVQIEWQE